MLGKKTWVANGPTADVFTVFANVRHRGEDGVQSNQLTAFIVDSRVSRISNIEKTKYKGKAWDENETDMETTTNAPCLAQTSSMTVAKMPSGVTDTYVRAVTGNSEIQQKQQRIIDNYGARIRIENVEKKCAELQIELDQYRREAEQKRWDSNVAHARDREELDSLNNLKKEGLATLASRGRSSFL